MTASPNPAAPRGWTREDVTADSSWQIPLPRRLADALLERSAKLADRPIRDITRADAALEPLGGVFDAVAHQLFDPEGLGFCVVSDVPVDGVDEDEAIRQYWLLGLQFGLPVTQSKRADFIGHVRRELGASAHRGYKSVEELGFHSDFPPVAGLLCLRPAPKGGESALVSGAAVHNVMRAERPDLLAVCYEPWALGRLDEQTPDEPAFSRQPIFAADGDRFGAFYNRTLLDHALELPGLDPLTPLQQEALDCFDEITLRPELQCRETLKTGDLLFLNNYRVLHARTSFEDSTDPALRRHLLRLWLRLDAADAAAPESVRFDYRFGNIGLTADQPPAMMPA
jgi:hypothetical protein